jgi:hypothetical protein
MCRECQKCDLYRVEDEDRVVKRAKDKAEREWWDTQGEGKKEGLEKEVGKKGVMGEKKGVEGWLEGVLDEIFV